jgi:capsular exopolysaccharide synthesis family protein
MILITTLTTFIVALVGRTLTPAKYESSAVIRVIPYSNSNPSYTQLAYADRIMKTYVEIGASSIVMANLRTEMGLAIDQPLSVDIRIIPDTELLRITVSDYDMVIARNVANALAAYLVNDKSIRDVRLSLLEPATAPMSSSILVTILFFVVAIATGMIGGIGVAFLLENIDTRLYEEEQVEKLSTLLVLGRIPLATGKHSQELLAGRYPYNHAFRRLVANLLTIAQDHQLRTIMVTSPGPLEGKSMITASLAYSLAQAGYRTLLVDLDLYRPTLHNYFGIPNDSGLGDLLLNTDFVPNVIIQTKLPLLWIIPSGVLSKRSEEAMMNSEEIARICGRLAGQYDFVILDSPAFLQVSDGVMLSPLVDGVLVVVRLGATREPALKAAFQQLTGVQANVIGLVVNAIESDHSVAYYQPSKRSHFISDIFSRKVRPPNNIAEKKVSEPIQPDISTPTQIENTRTAVMGLEEPTRPARRRKSKKNKLWLTGLIL